MTRVAEARRPRLLVLNQYYWPGVEATANLLSDLCGALADDFDVTVVTGLLYDVPTEPGRLEHDGVQIVRVRSTAYARRKLRLRAVNYVTYLVQSVRAGLAAPRPDVVLCMTDPPVVADIALLVARRFRVPLVVISQDVFPEIAVELQRLDNRFVIGLLTRLSASTSAAPTASSRSARRCAAGSSRRARGPTGSS